MKILRGYPKNFLIKMSLVMFFYFLYWILPLYFNFQFDTSFLLLVAISTPITILTLYLEGLLNRKILNLKYSLLYILLLISALYIYPQHISDVIAVLYNNGIREELFFRFFMIGIFSNYFIEYKESYKPMVRLILIYTNIFFVFSHPVIITQRIYLFLIGLILSASYLMCGIIPTTLLHTIHNLYLPEYHPIISIIAIIPLIYQGYIIDQDSSTQSPCARYSQSFTKTS